ncbi:MAG: FecCD family ABC transporter permease [Pikeienuella sp.]
MSRAVRALIGLALTGLALFAAALAFGDQPVPFGELIAALTGSPEASPVSVLIVNGLRLPRAMLAYLVGAALGAAGLIAQTVMRNPLAEPGLLGINAGAAAAALILLVRTGGASAHLVPWFAFAGALGMAAAIYALSWRGGASSIRIILIGIGLNALAAALAAFITAFGEVTAVQQAQVWLAGSVFDARWEKVSALALWLAPALVLAMLAARELDMLAFGENIARGLGQRAQLVSGLSIGLCALLAAAAVAAAGPVAFVGLIAPHAARRLVGRAHVRLLPVAAMTGGAIVLAADLFGRLAIAPAQLPVGLTTTAIGAPFFGWLLWRRRHVHA